MNILFLSLDNYKTLNEHGIYTDLLRQFAAHNHNVYVISPIEKRLDENAGVLTEGRSKFIRVKIGNITKTNLLEKGISTLLIESQILKAIKRELSGVRFDLVLYPTPPITFYECVKYIKKRDGARTYLMLKDIFPQNAVDLGILSKHGLKGIIYRYFRRKEKKLYTISDRIGCMSQANIDYVINHNPDVDPKKVELCPNSIEIRDLRLSKEESIEMRRKYNLPLEKRIFVYGGNLGRPQGIPFIIACLKASKDIKEAFFLIVGNGTEYGKLETYVREEKPDNVMLMRSLPKEEFDRMIAACDVGLVFLDHRFTIPNFPSRLLSYMQAGLPVLAATDPNTDVGKVVVDGGFGWWCESRSTDDFLCSVKDICNRNLDGIPEFEMKYLKERYDVANLYDVIIDKEKTQNNKSFVS